MGYYCDDDYESYEQSNGTYVQDVEGKGTAAVDNVSFKVFLLLSMHMLQHQPEHGGDLRDCNHMPPRLSGADGFPMNL